MSQIIEIEFKNLLTKEEYMLLIKEFKVEERQIFTQENHYFDTPKFALKQQDSALRIRRKGKSFEMTLKQPANIGLLETNQELSEEEALQAIEFGKIPGGIIQQQLSSTGIPLSQLEYFGSLITDRVELTYKDGLLVLDHSKYLTKEDYELEYEVKDYKKGKSLFLNLLQHYNIPARNTDNKIRRFYNQKYLQRES